MNREQRERVEVFGNEVSQAVGDLIENIFRDQSREDVSVRREEIYDEETCQEEVCREDIRPMPVGMNANLAHHDVNIKHVHNGFIVQVGCQTFVFETLDKMTKYMAIYYNDPQGAYEKHNKGELLKQYV
jgi:hypothetical protein